MIDFSTFESLSSIELGPAKPKPSSITGDQVEASRVLWQSDDGLTKIGVWECSPGRFSASRDTNSEICHIISGRVSLRSPNGNVSEVGPGEMLVLPLGWRGEWVIHEKTRKLYIINSPSSR